MRLQNRAKKGFTLTELLTVMSVIALLIGLLVPALNRVRIYAQEVKQRAQFHSMDMAIEFFKTEFEEYPSSSTTDANGTDNLYCGSQKLAEALVGWDLLGFHPKSEWRSDGKNRDNELVYDDTSDQNIRERTKPYIELENANAFKLEVFDGPDANFSGYDTSRFVLCDIFQKKREDSEKAGLPILYYRANVERVVQLTGKNSIYQYDNNDVIVKNQLSGQNQLNPLYVANGNDYEFNFNDAIWNKDIIDSEENYYRPYKSDSYILLSAGYDGLFGTPDDIFNFPKN